MAKKSKLLAALDAHKGKDYRLEKQKALRKQAEKRKRSKLTSTTSTGHDVLSMEEGEPQELNGNAIHGNATSSAHAEEDVDRSQSDDDAEYRRGNDSDDNMGGVNIEQLLKNSANLDASSGWEDDDLEDEEDGIPLSDIDSLASSEKEDLVPHQRLTINNTSALLRAYKSIALPASLPFSAHQSVSSATQTDVVDVNDDLKRELAFHRQSLDAVIEARTLFKKEGIPFTRPNDYFAEMVKSDEHMGKIKARMTEEAANKKAAAEARKQRDLKKFGKQVQVAKQQERDRAKRETLDKIKILKRKRKDTDTGTTHEEDLFDVALEDASKLEKPTQRRRERSDGKPREKRVKKDAKFGFGGKKRFSKSGDALSSGDLSGFSSKKMKGKPRLGKSRRAEQK